MPPTAEDPVARLRLLDGLGHHGDDLVPRFGLHQLEIELGPADAGEMCVTFDEAGNGAASLEVDDARVRTDERLHVRVGAQRDNACHRAPPALHVGLRRLDGRDLAARPARDRPPRGCTLARFAVASSRALAPANTSAETTERKSQAFFD